jgi:hypothetical protein
MSKMVYTVCVMDAAAATSRPKYLSKRDTPYWRCGDRKEAEGGLHEYIYRLRGRFDLYHKQGRDLEQAILDVSAEAVRHFPAEDWSVLEPLDSGEVDRMYRIRAGVCAGKLIWRLFNPKYPFGSPDERGAEFMKRMSWPTITTEAWFELEDALPKDLEAENIQTSIVRMWNLIVRHDIQARFDSGAHVDGVKELFGIKTYSDNGRLFSRVPGRKLLNERSTGKREGMTIAGSRGVATNMEFVEAGAKSRRMYSCGPEGLHDLGGHVVPSEGLWREDPQVAGQLCARRQAYLELWSSRLRGCDDITPDHRVKLERALGMWADVEAAATSLAKLRWIIDFTEKNGPALFALMGESVPWECDWYEKFGIPSDGKRLPDSSESVSLIRLWEQICPTSLLASLDGPSS